jgi:hypothetical protein
MPEATDTVEIALPPADVVAFLAIAGPVRARSF